MFCIPMLAAVGATIGRRASKGSAPVLPEPERADQPKVLVVGYGRVGKLVAEMLTRHQIPWMAIERVPKLIEAGRRAGHDVFFGDASRSELLQRFGLNAVLALVATMDSPEATEAVVVNARELRPDLTIVARARDAQQAKRLYELGASDAVPETIEASLQLSEALLVGIGIPTGSVIASIHQRRDEFRKELNNPNALGGRGRRIRQH
jgi:CPA2 family monovalent cation:H+ antiporter-2